MKTRTLLFVLAIFVSGALQAKFLEKTVRYEVDGLTFESTAIWEAGDEQRPGILMVPNWMGPSEASKEKARKVAGDDYVVFMVDMYGVDTRPADSGEASAAAGAVRADRELMRKRGMAALEQFRKLEGIPLKKDKVAAIGFCFGGGAVLELVRGGAALDAVVSFHGDLLSPTLEADAANTKSKVLVLHGAADPYVPQAHVHQWVDVMLKTSADWQLVQFSGAVHSFTDPYANAPGQAMYDARTAERAFEYMEELLEELWD